MARRGTIYSLGHLGVRILTHALALRLRVTGRARIPHVGGAIIVANHLSHYDSPLLSTAIRRPLSFMAMSELFTSSLWGSLARFAGAFPVERQSADRASLKHTLELLEAGELVVIFPEGQLSRTRNLQRVLPGAALLAMTAKVPIIPAGIWGSDRIMPYGPTLPRPTLAPVRIHFGEPLALSFDSLSKREKRRAATETMEAAIRHCTLLAKGRTSLSKRHAA